MYDFVAGSAVSVTPTPKRSLIERLESRGEGPDLRPRQAALTEHVVGEMTRTIPSFSNAPAPFLSIVEVVVGRIVEQALMLFRELRHPTRAEIRELVEVCVPPTDQGVTLEDMLAVFHLAQRVLWDELHELADSGRVADPTLALDLGRVGVALLTELSRGVTAEYLRGDRVWLRRRDAERALLHGVLDASPRPEEATRAAHALDLQLFGAWRVAVYEPVAEDADPTALLESLESARLTWGVRGAVLLEDRQVLLATQGEEALPPPNGSRVGIGGVHQGAQGMRTSHDEAADALAVGRRRGALRMTVEQARTGRVVLGSLSAAALADEVLGPIDAEPDSRREMLTETLAAWLDEQGSPTAVARRLRLHVQSARYRIEQLRDLLGTAMEDPDQRLQLQLALRARELTQPDTPPTGPQPARSAST